MNPKLLNSCKSCHTCTLSYWLLGRCCAEQEVIDDYMPPISQLERHVGNLQVYASAPYTLKSHKRSVTQRMQPCSAHRCLLAGQVRSSDSHHAHTNSCVSARMAADEVVIDNDGLVMVCKALHRNNRCFRYCRRSVGVSVHCTVAFFASGSED